MRLLPLLAALAALFPSGEDPAVPALDDANRAAWAAYLTPAADELRHETIAWIPSFGDGVRAADEATRPLLFWGMNGHPLGCT